MFTLVVTAVVVAGIIATVVAWFQRGWKNHATAYEQRHTHNREVMLQRVRQRWITGVLEQSLIEEAWVPLALTRKVNAVAPSVATIWPPGGLQAEALPASTSMSSVLRSNRGGLLILGAAGSGKTTALLKLARDLLDRAEADHAQPLPAVFNLSSWAARRAPFHEWLVEELYSRYGVSQSIAHEWVADGAVVPLLDGLDEVAAAHRSDCVEAINAFQEDLRAEHGLVRFVVCSRTEEYAALTTFLRVEEAVELQPPTREQVSGYLQAAGPALDDVQTALDADERLWDFLRSPFVLNIVASTYRGRSADALRVSGTHEQRLRSLFTAYIERTLEDPLGRHAPLRMVNWLAWLARSMREHGQTEFHLDQVEADWLPTNAQQRLVTIVPALGVGLFVGLVVVTLFDGVNFGLLFGLAFGLAAWKTKEQPVPEIHWSWLRLRGNLHLVLVGGLVIGLVVQLVLGLAVGLVFALVAWLGAGLVGGQFIRMTDRRLTPNAGLHRLTRHALIFGLLLALTFGVLIGLIYALVYGITGGLAGGPLVGLFFGLIFGLVCGLVIEGTVCLRKLVLRGLLTANGFAPVRYVRCLDEATTRLLLRSTGNGYLFVHRLLLEHLAGPNDTALPPPAAEPPTALHSHL